MKYIPLGFKAYFLFIGNFLIQANVPGIERIKNFITIGDYCSLRKALEIHKLNTKEQMDVLKHAKIIEAQSEQKLSMQSKI